MNDPVRTELEASLAAIADMIQRSKQAQARFQAGTSQHSLQENRIHSLRIAASLVRTELTGPEPAVQIPHADLEKAVAPIASLISKSEKAQGKLAPGTWQHAMLERNIQALRVAKSLLERDLGA